jgi:glucose-6-phosphate 1-dehydrogenase
MASFAFSTIELKDDTIIVVLGASGDLAKKKTVCCPLLAYAQMGIATL